MPFMLLKLCLTILLATAAAAKAGDMLSVGVTPTGVPFTFFDAEAQKPTGAMVDLADAIAADNRLTTNYQVLGFPALIPALTSGKIDLVSAGMFVTEKRKEVIAFSTPVYTFGEVLFVAVDDERNYTREDLKGEIVGAQIGSTFADALQKLGIFSQVKLYESIADIIRDVRLGRIKAGFGDQPMVAYQLSRNPGLGVRMIENYQPIAAGQIALAVRKDDVELLDAVNTSIGKLRADGQLAKIFAKYGL